MLINVKKFKIKCISVLVRYHHINVHICMHAHWELKSNFHLLNKQNIFATFDIR